MVENSGKTITLATRDPPCRIIQYVMAGATEQVAAPLSSAVNLPQTVRQK